MRPVIVHARNDFLLLTMDQMVNHAAKWRYMSGGKTKVPLTVRAIIGRGWGQAAQHSQSLQALFCHVPGLRVAMPSNPADAKGILMAAIASDFPTILIEHRLLFEEAGPVDEDSYQTPLGKGAVVRQGSDVTIVAISQMVGEAKKAAELLAGEGIETEVLDPRWLSPLDEELILASVEKTGRLVVADTGWTSGGVSAEIAARVAQNAFHALRAPVQRVALPDVPTPCSSALEKIYYPSSLEIAAAARRVLGLSAPSEQRRGDGTLRGGETFQGPF
jgi:pyruvate dehydrogenase E1 component beta subunit